MGGTILKCTSIINLKMEGHPFTPLRSLRVRSVTGCVSRVPAHDVDRIDTGCSIEITDPEV
jgi:hypothetical protein